MLILKEYNCTNEPKTNQQRPHMHWTVWKNESFKTETYKYTVESKFQFKYSSKLWNCGQFSTGSTFNELRSPGFEKLFFNLKNDPGYKFLIFYSQFSTLNIDPPPSPRSIFKVKNDLLVNVYRGSISFVKHHSPWLIILYDRHL